MNYFKLTKVFRDLALQAGDAIMEIYSRGNIAIETKSDSSPVTNADKTADTIIYRGLKKAFPDLDVVTEEKSESHYLRKRILFWLILSTEQKNLLIKRENSQLI